MNPLKSLFGKKDQVRSSGPNWPQDRYVRVEGESDMDAMKNLAGVLLSEFGSNGENVVISPSCLYQTLALMSEITGGATRAEIADALGGESTSQSIVDSILTIKAPEYGCRDFHYSTGSSVWLDESIRQNERFGTHARTTLPVEMRQVAMGFDDASQKMGKWLADYTGGIYSDAPQTDEGTLLVAMGAMHLKDSWESDFDEDDPRPFYLDDGSIQNTDFMRGWSHYDYLERDGSITLSKPLSSGCAMCISMPKEGKSIADYISDGSAWKNIMDYSGGHFTEFDRECKLYMPKFDLKSDGIDVAGIVRSLGINKMFLPDADFSPISPDQLMVSDVLQNTSLTIDEQGLEGASYVAVVMCGAAPPENPPEPKVIIIDRPFVVTVFSPDSIPLFVGTVMVPEEGEHLFKQDACCPVCYSDDVARILWGMPAFDETLEKNLEAGRVVLGGCCIPIGEEVPTHHCNVCLCDFSESDEACEAARDKAKEQLRGIVYGAAVGDALGVPYEFMGRDSFVCTGMVGGGAHGMNAGTFSDDTSLMLATCDSVGSLGVNIKDLREAFTNWLREGKYTPDGVAFDVGNATATALNQGRGCNHERSNGNGSLMRIAPLALTDASDDMIRDVSAITHAHSISKEACVAFVHILREVLHGECLEEAIENNIPDDTHFGFMHDIASWSRDDVRSTGYVIDTLGAALWCGLHTENYADCVLTAVNLGDDSDTTGCVAGALAGAMYGYDSIPKEWIEQLRGKEFIEDTLEFWF